jgi:hypothetical protein
VGIEPIDGRIDGRIDGPVGGPVDDLDRELQMAFERRPAPPSLKRKIMERRSQRNAARLHRRAVLWQRLAASVLLAGAVCGALAWRSVEQQRKGEAARQQVYTALRIAGRALNQMNAQLITQSQAQYQDTQ